MIKATGLTYAYEDGFDAVRGVDFEVYEGEFLAILGHNGSGKSTLAKLMNALFLPTGGEICVGGIVAKNEDDAFRVREKCGMVFQNPDNQIVATIVEEDVAFGLENLGVPSAEIRRRVDAALKTVGMEEYALSAPHMLSGGQKQRVAIAGVIAMEPEVIVLDEPTAMLDPQGRGEVVSTVTRLCREKGITVVFITHHMSECIGADRLVVMSNGLVAADGTPAQVFSDVELMRREGLAVPATTEVEYELNKCGFELPLSALTVEDCAGAIAASLKIN